MDSQNIKKWYEVEKEFRNFNQKWNENKSSKKEEHINSTSQNDIKKLHAN